MDREDYIASLAEKLDAYMAAQVEYKNTHKDAGDAYSHMPREGDFQYGNGDDRLAAWMEKLGIQARGMEPDQISEVALDNFYMEAGTIQNRAADSGKTFTVGTFPVGEVEVQFDAATLAAIDPGATEADWLEAKDEADTFFKGEFAYETSDAVWYAYIDADTLAGLIADATADCEELEM